MSFNRTDLESLVRQIRDVEPLDRSRYEIISPPGELDWLLKLDSSPPAVILGTCVELVPVRYDDTATTVELRKIA